MSFIRSDAKWHNTKVVTRYLHGDNDELADLWDYEAEQQETYHYSLYELALDYEVDLPTGYGRIIAINGQTIDPPIVA